MTIFIIVISILGYLSVSAVTVGALMADDPKWKDDGSDLAAGALSLLWPLIWLFYGLWRVGKFSHDRTIAARERRALPEARVVK